MTLGTMKKFFLTFGLLFSMLLTGCGGVSESLKGEKIIVGIDDEFAPMGFKDENNEIVGFDVDLAKETIKRLGGEAEFKVIDWSNKEAELNSGNIDLIWNALDITPERQEQMLFSKPYMDSRQIVLIHLDNDKGIATEEDLAGKIVGVQKGSTGEVNVNANEKLRNSLKELKTYKTSFLSAFIDLENGRIDAAICDEIIIRYHIEKHPGKFKALDVTIGPVSIYGVAFAKENTDLRDKIQKSLDTVIEDGTAAEISKKWFGADLIKKK